tara:strand:- start:3583 stop:3924 length:342 start_codon:yes stop_codon:yes gene_type:complete
MAKLIQFDNKINTSLQLGDYAWIADIDATTGVTTTAPVLIGTVIEISPSSILVNEDAGYSGIILPSSFIMFSKPIEVNKSSVRGYYADVTFKNTSNKRAELFAISSEVAPSSK